MISRLQSASVGAGSVASAIQAVSAASSGNEAAAAEAEAARVQQDLAKADAELKAIRADAQAAGAGMSATAARAEALKSKVEDQAAEIARLNAALAAYEVETDGQPNVIRDSRIASKAKVSSLQAQIATQNETIQKLRAELAANNERLARQAAQFAEEMRRLGAGTVPTSAEPRRGRETQPRRSLSDRISQTVSAPADAAQPGKHAGNGLDRAPTNAKVAEYLKALTDSAPVAAANEAGAGAAVLEPTTAMAGDAPTAGEGDPAQNRVRLLDRIAGIAKT